jgi:DNA-binding CsgD family transcriptional regulator
MSKYGWNIILCNPDQIFVEYLDGEIVIIRSDGRSGYGFVTDYLELMSTHYSRHLKAVDEILRRMLGCNYEQIRKIRRVYESKLAVISINCAFGGLDNYPHCDLSGNLSFSAPECPLRAVCPFNGKGKINKECLYGCNPIYETKLSQRQIEIAILLVETPLNTSEIAGTVYLDEGRIRNISSEIYASLGVKNRQELVCFLRGKRLL